MLYTLFWVLMLTAGLPTRQVIGYIFPVPSHAYNLRLSWIWLVKKKKKKQKHNLF